MKRLLALLLSLCLLLCGCRYPTRLEPKPVTAPTAPTEESQPEPSGLTVHCLDVGQADCILLECEGQYMLIDGGNRDDSRLLVAYLQAQGVEKLVAVVCTHAHEDHVGGLPAALAVFPTRAVYAPVQTCDSQVFEDFLRYTDQQGLGLTVPSPGDEWMLGEARVTVLGPVKSYDEPNNTSIVLLVEYGTTRFLFTGDMEAEAEGDMLDHWAGEMNWDVDVLKVGHHGSDTSSGYRFLYETQPEYGIISVGTDNPYGHPSGDVLKRYADAGVAVYRTDRLGHVVAHSDGETVTLTWEKESAEPEATQDAEGITFIANRKSGVFHSSQCGSLPKESNRIYFDSYQEALDAGYTPCGGCLG